MAEIKMYGISIKTDTLYELVVKNDENLNQTIKEHKPDAVHANIMDNVNYQILLYKTLEKARDAWKAFHDDVTTEVKLITNPAYVDEKYFKIKEE